MNYTTQNQNNLSDLKTAADNKVTASVEMLELFAEELPVQNDLMQPHCVSSVACASTAATSTVGTVSSFATL